MFGGKVGQDFSMKFFGNICGGFYFFEVGGNLTAECHFVRMSSSVVLVIFFFHFFNHYLIFTLKCWHCFRVQLQPSTL